MIIEYNGIKYKIEHDKSLNMTLLYNATENENNNQLVSENVIDINNVLSKLDPKIRNKVFGKIILALLYSG